MSILICLIPIYNVISRHKDTNNSKYWFVSGWDMCLYVFVCFMYLMCLVLAHKCFALQTLLLVMDDGVFEYKLTIKLMPMK